MQFVQFKQSRQINLLIEKGWRRVFFVLLFLVGHHTNYIFSVINLIKLKQSSSILIYKPCIVW